MTNRSPPVPPASPAEISIAITVYDRRTYVHEAIRSALSQSLPVEVFVVEDCSPDPGMRAFTETPFPGKLQYLRNPERRGLFDTWNACLEACRTPWLSILHDDDLLRPGFVESILNLSAQAPGCALYACNCELIDETGASLGFRENGFHGEYWHLDPVGFAYQNFVLFPGQLIHVGTALELGGFRSTSQYCGDWEMWHRLTVQAGAAQSAEYMAGFRTHRDISRGTNRIVREGRKRALEAVQIRRNLARVNQATGSQHRFSRKQWLSESPLSLRELLCQTTQASRRLLRYNLGLLRRSRAPHSVYRLVSWLLLLGGPGLLSWVHRRSR